MTTPHGDVLQGLMAALDHAVNGPKPEGATDPSWRKVGLVLFTFPFGDASGLANYVSNGADRADMIKFLRETADRFERQLAEADNTADQIRGADIGGMIQDEIAHGTDQPMDEMVDAVARRLADEGKIVEAGWHGYKRIFHRGAVPASRLRENRRAFLAGADHMFSSAMQIMDQNGEPTEQDMQRMDLIWKELQAFQKETYGK